MPKCSRCGDEIVFKAHPKNPEKMAPFNTDVEGEIHFSTCRVKAEGKSFASIKDIRIKGGKLGGVAYVHVATTVAGDRLRATFPDGCGEMIAMTDQNNSLINAERDFHQELKEIAKEKKHLEWLER